MRRSVMCFECEHGISRGGMCNPLVNPCNAYADGTLVAKADMEALVAAARAISALIQERDSPNLIVALSAHELHLRAALDRIGGASDA